LLVGKKVEEFFIRVESFSMTGEFKGQVVLITGAAQGLGLSMAEAFSEKGAVVVGTDVNYAGLRTAARQQPGLEIYRMDVTKPSDIRRVVKAVEKRHGKIDVLVNNAGVNTLHHRVNVDKFPVQEWNRLIEVNLTGAFLVAQGVLPGMLKRKNGRIIQIGSVLGKIPARLQCAFNSAKAGLAQLTRSMAIELGSSGILVNCVAPGSIMTDGTKKLFYGNDAKQGVFSRRLLAHIPMGRAGLPKEVSGAVLFFASPASAYVTGQVLCVDGGWTAGGFLRDF
jgi:NAD(P)-dependent dehydrogenase (short-subunit alcohol dehydrogenase family)